MRERERERERERSGKESGKGERGGALRTFTMEALVRSEQGRERGWGTDGDMGGDEIWTNLKVEREKKVR